MVELVQEHVAECQDYTNPGYRAHSTAQVLRLGRLKTEDGRSEMKEGRAQDSFFVCLLSKPFIIIGCQKVSQGYTRIPAFSEPH